MFNQGRVNLSQLFQDPTTVLGGTKVGMLTEENIDYCLTPGLYVGNGTPQDVTRYSLVIVLSIPGNSPRTSLVAQISFEAGTKTWYTMNLWYRAIYIVEPEEQQYTPNFVGRQWAAMNFEYRNTAHYNS